jgi:hypothetical protein
METWQEIKGYEGLYLVSNYGNIKSLGNQFKRKDKILKPGNDKKGYKLVVLCNNKIKKTHKVHRLVANAFIDNYFNKPQVNHINGIKYDNNSKNLEWCTEIENVKHSFDNGLVKICKKVIDTNTGNVFQSIAIASKQNNINYSTLYNMLNGKIFNLTTLKFL